MPMKLTPQFIFLVICMTATLVACERTAPAPVPPTSSPAPKPTLESAAPIAPVAATEPTIEPATQPNEHAEDWGLPGSLLPLTTRLELETRFGKANVREETFDGPEGDGSYPVLVVFPDDPSKRLELVQEAANPDAPIVELRVSDPATHWRDANGLHPGMTLAELVTLNGAPVSFYGLDWDYGGAVQDWHGGKLANAVDATTFHRVALAARGGTQDARLPQGDRSFRSDDASYPTLGNDLVVSQLGISWPHEGED